MQPLCCFINENQPLNEGASTAVTHLEVDTARQSGRRIGPQGVMFEDRASLSLGHDQVTRLYRC